jgi:hypothetical protein
VQLKRRDSRASKYECFKRIFDQAEEKDPYYNFIKLHLTEEHGKAVEWRTVDSEGLL